MANPRGNPENFIPNEERTPEERRKNTSKAGKASGIVRREKRDAKEATKLFLDMAAAGNLDDILAKLDVKEKDRTNLMGIVARHVVSAQSGNVNSARLVLEMAGMLQKNNTENSVTINVDSEDDKVVFILPDNGRD